MKMGDRIRQMRIDAGMTQEELAEKLGLQKSAIAKYENGKRSATRINGFLKFDTVSDSLLEALFIAVVYVLQFCVYSCAFFGSDSHSFSHICLSIKTAFSGEVHICSSVWS